CLYQMPPNGVACINFLYYSLCAIAIAISQFTLLSDDFSSGTFLKSSSVYIKCHLMVSLV
ncbi:MAG: hypothetical protein ACI4PF_06470, partial [Christensenellales bacterium]